MWWHPQKSQQLQHRTRNRLPVRLRRRLTRKRTKPISRGAVERAGFHIGGRLISSVTPVSLALLGAVIANLPVTLSGNHLPAPLLGLMPLYFWALLRPDLVTPAWVALIG